MTSYIPIASQTLTATANTITFSSIPSTLNGKNLRDLILIVAPSSSSYGNSYFRLNADATNSYHDVYMSANGSSTLSGTRQFNPTIYLEQLWSPFDNNNYQIQIMDYAQTNKHKPVLYRSNSGNSGTMSGALVWSNTAAVTSLTFHAFSTNTFAIGSTFSLYGIEG